MPVHTAELFLGLLEKSHLLSPPQLAQARALPGAGPQAIAQSLVKQVYLTTWQAQQLLAGRQSFFLGKYKLFDKLGEGGMGAVYKAQQTTTARMVAIKVMSENVVKQPGAVSRFHREIRAVAALQHPNIVAAFDADQVGETHFLVMEYAEGRDLKEWIKEYGKLPIDWSCECIRQAALGLQHAHERGLAHRDIKPSNLLVVSSDMGGLPQVKILDMGLARFTSETQCTVLTQTGQVLGTIDYISPEQAKDTKGAGIQADIFSLGASLFHMITGQVPFLGKSPMEKLMARAMRDAPRASTLSPAISPALDEILARMLARKPSDRFQTPDEVAAVLSPFCLGASSDHGSSPTLPKSAAPTAGSTIAADADVTLTHFQAALESGPAVKEQVDLLEVSADSRSRRLPLKWIAAAALLLVFGIGMVWSIFSRKPQVAAMNKDAVVKGSTADGQGRKNVDAVSGRTDAAIAGSTPIDLVARADTVRDAIAGSWNKEGGSLVTGGGKFKLFTPQPMPDQYDVEMEIERLKPDGTGCVFGFLMQGRQAVVLPDSYPPPHLWGIEDIDGHMARETTNPTAVPGSRLPLNQRRTVRISVRRTGVSVSVGGEQVVDWRGRPEQLGVSFWRIADSNTLFLGAQQKFAFHRITLTPVLTPGRESTSAATEIQRYASDEWIDVIPLIDPKRDKFDLPNWTGKNEWFIENGELVVGRADAKPCKLIFPLDLQGKAFECEVEFTRRSGSAGFNLDVPAKGPCPIIVDHNVRGKVALGHPQLLFKEACNIKTGQRATFRFRVRDNGQDEVTAWFNGTLLGTWRGNRDEIAAEKQEGYPHDRRTSLWIHNPDRQYVFHRIRLRMLDGGAAETLRPVPLSSAPPLAVAPFDAAQAKAHQQRWASRLGTTVETTNRVGAKMVLIPPGEFLMGSTEEQIAAALRAAAELRTPGGDLPRIREDERPRHRVVFRRPFLIGATEVTIGQFRQFVDATQYATDGERFGAGNSASNNIPDSMKNSVSWKSPGYEAGDNSPVVQVTWNDAAAFCNWLNAQEKLAPCYAPDGNGSWSVVAGASGYRLPTEAEWEYACRAGTTSQYSFGDDPAELGQYAWYEKNLGNRSHPVGTKQPNPFGLYDMHGNVWEWCQDWHERAWYQNSPVEDPEGPPTGKNRVIRGGTQSSHSRSAYRHDFYHTPLSRHGFYGFRIVRALDPRIASDTASVIAAPIDSPSQSAAFNGHRYQWVEKVVSWNQAQAEAESLGGHLATITSQDEDDWIRQTFGDRLQANNTGFWLGASQSQADSPWQWITGEPLTFTRWGNGEPNCKEKPDENQPPFYLNYFRSTVYPDKFGWNDTALGPSPRWKTQNLGYLIEWDDPSKATTPPPK